MGEFEKLYEDFRRGHTDAILAFVVTALTVSIVSSMACMTCAQLLRLRRARRDAGKDQKQGAAKKDQKPCAVFEIEPEHVLVTKESASIKAVFDAFMEEARSSQSTAEHDDVCSFPASEEPEGPQTPPVISDEEVSDGESMESAPSDGTPRRHDPFGKATVRFKELHCATAPDGELRDGQQVEYFSKDDQCWLRGRLEITQERMFELFVGETKFHLIMAAGATGQRRVLRDVPKHLVRPMPVLQPALEDVSRSAPPEYAV
mmetsp:Transcript_53990/g.106570  ORF Transcript_53990/g.106570 Transcript_53990/m.106570 type:complete len:260 (+) Transcript_53990:77-856(+)|eukprot:CAMPEP_0170266430 /NCGR_PEP_ID=MMETSP0116_2-20130129/33130_1 /TAXON_ID=400756 /ORGANISM="Durinskia baltica, Strain CSIRO CS-38" /LENGTH=259 /DNA_ID=CAMNT_0010517563 /DNA_START=80 /DNA_END=859 /DNA_ORIENTATION=+